MAIFLATLIEHEQDVEERLSQKGKQRDLYILIFTCTIDGRS